MKYLLFLLTPLIAFSFFEEPTYSFDGGAGGGYRQDSMKRHWNFGGIGDSGFYFPILRFFLHVWRLLAAVLTKLHALLSRKMLC